MMTVMEEIILKNFDKPDEIRKFDKGQFEIVKVANMTIGRATYAPGWKWSIDVSPLVDTEFCEVEHLGMVIAGGATVALPAITMPKCSTSQNSVPTKGETSIDHFHPGA